MKKKSGDWQIVPKKKYAKYLNWSKYNRGEIKMNLPKYSYDYDDDLYGNSILVINDYDDYDYDDDYDDYFDLFQYDTDVKQFRSQRKIKKVWKNRDQKKMEKIYRKLEQKRLDVVEREEAIARLEINKNTLGNEIDRLSLKKDHISKFVNISEREEAVARLEIRKDTLGNEINTLSLKKEHVLNFIDKLPEKLCKRISNYEYLFENLHNKHEQSISNLHKEYTQSYKEHEQSISTLHKEYTQYMSKASENIAHIYSYSFDFVFQIVKDKIDIIDEFYRSFFPDIRETKFLKERTKELLAQSSIRSRYITEREKNTGQ